MYPIFRMSKALIHASRNPVSDISEEYSCEMRIRPWDLDMFMELNNGRTLTLYDIPRLSWGQATGFNKMVKREGYKIAVAGASVLYRKRITLFQKVKISVKFAGVDERFFYVIQNMIRGNEAVGQILVRKAVVKNGIVNPLEAFAKMGIEKKEVPELPEWVKAWSEAEAKRPWPPSGGINEK